MDRTEKTGLGVAIAGHIVLFGLLSVGFLATPNPLKLRQDPMDVTLATDAAIESEAPRITEEPAMSQAPETGAPEEAAPATQAQVAEAEPQPAPPRPAAAPPPKPAEKAKPQPPKPTRPAPKAAAAPAKTQGKSATATATRTRGSRLGADFLKGITDRSSKSQVQAPRAAKVGARDVANISGLIKRQVQPCYDLGSLAGTSAMSIVTILRLQIRRDGSVAAATVSDQNGVNGDNQSYARQMGELSRRALLRCSPLKGLPPELYEGGWEDIEMTFRPSDFN